MACLLVPQSHLAGVDQDQIPFLPVDPDERTQTCAQPGPPASRLRYISHALREYASGGLNLW